MIKKLAVVATYAGTMLMGMPAAASGSPAMCFAQYNADMTHCSEMDPEGGMPGCAQFAVISLQNCLQSLVTVEQ